MSCGQNHDSKRSFLQETAFEEDVNLDDTQEKRHDSQTADYIRRYWARKAAD